MRTTLIINNPPWDIEDFLKFPLVMNQGMKSLDDYLSEHSERLMSGAEFEEEIMPPPVTIYGSWENKEPSHIEYHMDSVQLMNENNGNSELVNAIQDTGWDLCTELGREFPLNRKFGTDVFAGTAYAVYRLYNKIANELGEELPKITTNSPYVNSVFENGSRLSTVGHKQVSELVESIAQMESLKFDGGYDAALKVCRAAADFMYSAIVAAYSVDQSQIAYCGYGEGVFPFKGSLSPKIDTMEV
ncbi:MAG: hypothetical protein MAG795_00145 [Candidatus Woesearchaeota archaeon]|nr:hypothetical protein [Candidatus Woesearchaeota archaeon]